MTNWLLLHYKLPTNPSALRVYTWRKLKRIGAILLHDAIWVVPETIRTKEQYQWLVAEIQEMGGEAYYWQASSISEGDDQAMVEKFNRRVNEVYTKLLKKLEKSGADLQEISQQYQQTAAQDFFHSKLGLQVRDKLMSRRGEKI